MHDWEETIRRKLMGLPLSRSRRENLTLELANHLEDLYAELVASGIPEPLALRSATIIGKVSPASRRTSSDS